MKKILIFLFCSCMWQISHAISTGTQKMMVALWDEEIATIRNDSIWISGQRLHITPTYPDSRDSRLYFVYDLDISDVEDNFFISEILPLYKDRDWGAVPAAIGNRASMWFQVSATNRAFISDSLEVNGKRYMVGQIFANSKIELYKSCYGLLLEDVRDIVDVASALNAHPYVMPGSVFYGVDRKGIQFNENPNIGDVSLGDIFLSFADEAVKENLLKEDSLFINGDYYQLIPSFPNLEDPQRALYYDILLPMSEAKALVPYIEQIEGVKVEGVFGAVEPGKDPTGDDALMEDELLPCYSSVYCNPGTQMAELGLYIPASVKQASVFLYDSFGRQLAVQDLPERGEYSFSLDMGQYASGIYLCALVCDGKIVATERIVH